MQYFSSKRNERLAKCTEKKEATIVINTWCKNPLVIVYPTEEAEGYESYYPSWNTLDDTVQAIARTLSALGIEVAIVDTTDLLDMASDWGMKNEQK